MREAYRGELDAVSERLVAMARATGDAMTFASQALLETDIARAEDVIAADRSVDNLRDELDDRVVDLLARQQPVATELRIVVTALRMADDIERMGDLALHVAKLTRLRYPQPVVPDSMRVEFATMGTIARRLSTRLATIIADHDADGAHELDRDDDEMDLLHRRHFAVLAAESWPYGVESAIDLTLTSRYYERYADHAVKAARRVYYLVTGSRPAPSASLR